MAHINRETTAPIRDGEKVIASDVENEFAKIFAAIGQSGAGTLDSTNFSHSANILGSQFANTTITGDNFAEDTITTSRMATTAVTKAAFYTELSTSAMTNSATMVDVPDITSITLTPGSTSDVVTMGFQFTGYHNNFGGADIEMNFGFNIDDGTGDVEVSQVHFDSGDYLENVTRLVEYSMVATAASATVYKPIYRRQSGAAQARFGVAGYTFDYSMLFYVYIMPIK